MKDQGRHLHLGSRFGNVDIVAGITNDVQGIFGRGGYPLQFREANYICSGDPFGMKNSEAKKRA